MKTIFSTTFLFFFANLLINLHNAKLTNFNQPKGHLRNSFMYESTLIGEDENGEQELQQKESSLNVETKSLEVVTKGQENPEESKPSVDSINDGGQSQNSSLQPSVGEIATQMLSSHSAGDEGSSHNVITPAQGQEEAVEEENSNEDEEPCCHCIDEFFDCDDSCDSTTASRDSQPRNVSGTSGESTSTSAQNGQGTAADNGTNGNKFLERVNENLTENDREEEVELEIEEADVPEEQEEDDAQELDEGIEFEEELEDEEDESELEEDEEEVEDIVDVLDGVNAEATKNVTTEETTVTEEDTPAGNNLGPPAQNNKYREAEQQKKNANDLIKNVINSFNSDPQVEDLFNGLKHDMTHLFTKILMN